MARVGRQGGDGREGDNRGEKGEGGLMKRHTEEEGGITIGRKCMKKNVKIICDEGEEKKRRH